MAAKNLYGLTGKLELATSSVATILRVTSALSGAIVAPGFTNGTDHTYFALTANNVYEVIKVVAVNGQDLTVERGVEGTVAQPFPIGSKLEFVVTAQGVLETLGPITSNVQIVANPDGIFTATLAGGIWTLDVPYPQFHGTGGIEILGDYPNLTWTYTASDCCGTAATGVGAVNIVGQGIVTAYVSGSSTVIAAEAPYFYGVGCTIEGTWPNYTITVNASGGGAGTGTVESVGASGGLTLTGNPAINPLISITNTGVVAGNYGGVEINARGQIAAVPSTFNPISILTAGSGIGLTRTTDNVTISVAAASISVPGTVQLVDPTDPYDPANATEALTPAALAVALAGISGSTAVGASNYTGEADAAYTNTLGGSAQAFELGAGKKAIIYAEVTMVDGTTPLTAVPFGIAIFNATPSRVRADRKITQSKQVLSFLLEGPIATTTYAIVTTAIPAGASVVSYSLYIQKLP